MGIWKIATTFSGAARLQLSKDRLCDAGSEVASVYLPLGDTSDYPHVIRQPHRSTTSLNAFSVFPSNGSWHHCSSPD